jgi:hypothetical protein
MARATLLVVLAACMQQNPPPQYARQQPVAQPQPAPPAQPAQPAVATTPPVEPAPPMKPDEPLPIPIDKAMPTQSLTTDTKLVVGTEATVMIDARSDVYSATAKKADGPRGGVLPSTITLAAGGGLISFPKVNGKAACVATEGTNADGGACAGGNTDLETLGKLSGIKHHQRTMFLVGVFVGAKLPGKPPAILDFSDDAKGTKFAKLEPLLGQVFYIGDGKPGEPNGETHDFVIPKGATRLYLGYADGANFQGSPSSYDDNVGGLSVTVLQRK